MAVVVHLQNQLSPLPMKSKKQVEASDTGTAPATDSAPSDFRLRGPLSFKLQSQNLTAKRFPHRCLTRYLIHYWNSVYCSLRCEFLEREYGQVSVIHECFRAFAPEQESSLASGLLVHIVFWFRASDSQTSSLQPFFELKHFMVHTVLIHIT